MASLHLLIRKIINLHHWGTWRKATEGSGGKLSTLYANMKQSVLIILLVVSLFTSYGQSNKLQQSSNKETTEFKNQGEQEDYWAKELFKNEYIKKPYSRYSDKIFTLDNKTFHFGGGYLEITYTADSLIKIFHQGLLYPDLLGDPYSLKITDLHEVKFLSTMSTVKRFKFWVFRNGLENPQVYFIELTNELANETTDMTTFLKGSTLTFVKPAWIVL